ncbi:hypothetical protein PQG02_11300 [Nostoc sp. UHCC 0926]|nr:hypothetical protein [Nostoc sp. UHCC 0926]WDD34858.1 hypothetical protein PQG02_11300 [Nostoc sp. UHCC 0926]
MSKITISDLAIDRDEKSLVEQLTEQEVNGIFGGLEITVSVTIKF